MMLPLAEPHLLNLSPYVPGRSVSGQVAKLASNENALGPSPLAMRAAAESLSSAHIYPIADRLPLKNRICALWKDADIRPEHVVLGNGLNELIVLMIRAFVSRKESVLVPWPSFLMYRVAAQVHGVNVMMAPLRDDLNIDLEALARCANDEHEQPVKMIFLANPNNPTGRTISKRDFDAWLLTINENVIVVVDEAYAEYVNESDYEHAVEWVQRRPRVVVMRTFSKIYGLAGLRVGYALCDPAIANLLHRIRDPFNVSNVAQQAACAALDDHDHVTKSRSLVIEQIPIVSRRLQQLGFRVTPSAANFVLIHAKSTMPPTVEIIERLMNRGVVVRPVDNSGLLNAIRVTIGTQAQNSFFLNGLSEILAA